MPEKIKAYKRTLIARVEKTKKFQAAMTERVCQTAKEAEGVNVKLKPRFNSQMRS